ncbi:MAG: flagellar biosynthesis protein FlhB [Candidatus Pelethousia sp.]|nr:flagellar biosynthesis protein FlhB [Candidatus Pelethousia sp.]
MAQEGSGGERTEKATPKKRKDARERGQVRKSNELVTAVMLLLLFGALRLFGPGMWERMAALMRAGLKGQLAMGEALESGEIPSLLARGALELGLTILPILGVAFLGAAAVNLIQVGFLFSSKALAPKMDRLNPIKGLQRIFSLHTLYEMGKSIGKILLIGFIAYTKYMAAMERFGTAAWKDSREAGALILFLITDAGLTVGLALLILAGVDYFYQWWKYEKDLRMTKYEVKLEYKQQEGDPQIKGRIRQKQRQMAMMRMMQAVPEADVVITNPTHYAVALKYDDGKAKAPIVTAKGQGFVAQRIKEIAREHGVELVENRPVAQGLYQMCEIGSEVPFELYQAVAEILAYVYKLKKGR